MSLGGIQFSGEGPMMSGTWYNPQTGHKFTVRDCFFEDNNFIVIATNGQRYDYNTIQHYIQCTDKDGKPMEPDSSVMAPRNQQVKTTLPPEVSSILAEDNEYADLMTPEDMAMSGVSENPLTKGLGNLNERFGTKHIAPATEHVAAPISQPYQHIDPADAEDLKMIDRVLRRLPRPEFNAEIEWKEPGKQISTLIEMFGIGADLIAQYYVDKLDKDSIFEGIKQKLADYINSQYGESDDTAATTIDVPVATPKPKTKAKKIKK